AGGSPALLRMLEVGDHLAEASSSGASCWFPRPGSDARRGGSGGPPRPRMTRGERLAAGSIALGSVVLGIKSLAWWITGSVALYSDALETIVNVVGSAVALAALGFAARPADENHPYGHDKAEFFAAVIEGVMIVIAALSIFNEAW